MRASVIAAAAAVLMLGACSGEPADTSKDDPAQVAAANTALTESCMAKEGATEAFCACYVGKVAEVLTPKEMQIQAKIDKATPEELNALQEEGNALMMKEGYEQVTEATLSCDTPP